MSASRSPRSAESDRILIDSPRRSLMAVRSRSDIAVYGLVILASLPPVSCRALLTLVTYCRFPMP
ncbi:MAG TPA: hypothetical protein VN277_07770 [Acidiferrobacterales bacterium]|nr:hypothetical protein [Acidiferrobacterales bacterium]